MYKYEDLSNIYWGVFALVETMKDNTFSFLGTAFVCNSKGYLATCSHNINLSTAKNLHIVSIDVPLNEFLH